MSSLILKFKKSIKSKLFCLVKNMSNKQKLIEPSIVINRKSWNLFNKMDFKNSSLNLVVINGLYEIEEKSYDNVVAYIGEITDKKILKKLPNLIWLQLVSHGINGYDKKEIYASKSVTVTNMHGVFSKPIANFCLTAWHIFNCPSFSRKISDGKITCGDAEPYSKKSVLIYGLGDIGSEIARTFSGLGWEVYGVKRTITDVMPSYVKAIWSLDDSLNYLKQFNYVISVLPETTETIGVFDASFFSQMNPNAIFCNVGRGSSVVDADLDVAIQKGVIKGAVLDAVSNYKYSASNIILTSHSSYLSSQNDIRIDELFTVQLESFISSGVVNLSNKIPLQ